jgi:hypothetical protein
VFLGWLAISSLLIVINPGCNNVFHLLQAKVTAQQWLLVDYGWLRDSGYQLPV